MCARLQKRERNLIGSRTRSGDGEPSLSRTSVSYRFASYPYRTSYIVSCRIASVSYPPRIVSSHEPAHRIVSYRNVSLSYRIVSYRIVIAIVSHRIVSVSVSSHEPAYRIASCLIATVIVSYPYRIRSIVSRTIVSHRIVSYRVVSYRTVSYHAVSYRYRYRIVSVSSHDPLYRIVSYRVVSYRTVSHHAVSYHYRYRIVSASSHAPLYRIVSYRILASPRLHVSTSPRLHVAPRLHVLGLHVIGLRLVRPSERFTQ